MAIKNSEIKSHESKKSYKNLKNKIVCQNSPENFGPRELNQKVAGYGINK